MHESPQSDWPPKNWDAWCGPKTSLVFLCLYMLVLPAWLNYVILGFAVFICGIRIRARKIERELAQLQQRKAKLIAERKVLNQKLFEKFGPYTNEYGVKISE
jgi:hypothetical protein